MKKSWQKIMANAHVAQTITWSRLKLLTATNWFRLRNIREQVLIILLAMILLVALILSLITSLYNMSAHIKQLNAKLNNDKNIITAIVKENNILNKVPLKQFARFDLAAVNNKAATILNIDKPKVSLASHKLTIQASDVSFAALLLLIDDLRGSYGIFPSSARIIRGTKSGYVNFNISFAIEWQQNAIDN